MEGEPAGGEEKIVRNGAIPLDEVIDIIDWGPYQLHLLCLIGVCTACDSMEIGLIAFLQECIKEDWHLDSSQEALLSSSILIGQILGISSASIADTVGRRPVIIVGLWFVIIFGFASSYAPDYISLIVLRTLAGYGIGVSQCVSYDLCCEILPRKYRKFIMFCDVVGVAAQLYLIIALYFLLEAYGWRAILFACAVPILFVGIASIWIFLESPRWLLTRNREEEARKIVQYIAEYNGKVRSDRVTYDLQNINLKYEYNEEDNHAGYTELLTPEQRPRTIHLWIVWCFAYFGFFAVVFSMIALQRNKEKDTCSYDYQNVVISGSSDIVLLLLTMYFVDMIGRAITQSSLYALSSIFALAWSIVLDKNPTDIITMTILLMISKATSVGGMEAMWLQTMELFPTWLRATGHTSCVIIGRIGAVGSTYWVDSFIPLHPLAGSMVVAISLAVAAIGAFFLKETSGKSLDSDKDEEKSSTDQNTEAIGERMSLLESDDYDALGNRREVDVG